MATTDSVGNVISQNKFVSNPLLSPKFDSIFVAHKLHEFAASSDQGKNPCDIVAINLIKMVLKSPQLDCDKSCIDLVRNKSHRHVLTNFTEPYPCLCHVTVKLKKCLKGKGANFSQFNPTALFRLGRPFCVNKKIGAVVSLFRASTNRTVLSFVHQVLEMLVTVVNCYQRDEVKWKRLSGQIIDLLLPLLANQKVA